VNNTCVKTVHAGMMGRGFTVLAIFMHSVHCFCCTDTAGKTEVSYARAFQNCYFHAQYNKVTE
jgi:hypothetical protein